MLEQKQQYRKLKVCAEPDATRSSLFFCAAGYNAPAGKTLERKTKP
ncbi:MAG: hypothetical protein JW904_06310 [Spirochaetales bacterium]|nr:hypothetical protein [Spirochaetales bacterium]